MSQTKSALSRLLVVDDNQDAARSLATLLQMAGYRVKTAFDGATALLVAASFDPEACILDINMPGLNGYELASRLRQIGMSHPLVLATMTAYSDFEHLDRAVRAGFDLHFTKPADPADVAEQLKHAYQELVASSAPDDARNRPTANQARSDRCHDSVS